jgi:transcriptional regulator with XRE-family HTH domain
MKRTKKYLKEQHLIQKIHAAAKERGWTLHDMAAAIEVSHVHLTSLTSGARKLSGLSQDKQRALCKIIGISMLDFYLMSGLLRYDDLLIE